MLLDLNNLFPEPASGAKRAPLPKQQQFLDLVLDPKGPKFVGYYGGYGSGKSLILCIVNIVQGILYGGEYVIARSYAPELRRTTYKLFLELLPPELLIENRIADAEVHIKSAKGKAIFYFVGLDDPGKLDSLTLSGASIDEASQVSEEAFLKLQGRLRSPKGLRKLLIVGNPKGHDWAYRYFIKQDMFDTPEKKATYKLIVAPSTENTHLPDGYIESMLSSYSKERIQRDIMGSFDSFEGMVYNEFNRNIHVIKPFKIPTEWTKAIGADHGYNAPAAFLWGASDYDGNLYIYREFYEREWTIEEICKGHRKTNKPGVIALSRGETLDGIWIDPSTKADRGRKGGSDWDIYTDNLPKKWPLLPAKNDVTAGIDQVKYYLKVNPRTNKPKIFIFDTCVNLLDEISQYRYEEVSPGQQGKVNEKEKPRKYKDHACDALRYLIMSRPEGPKAEDLKKKRLEADTPEAAIQRDFEKYRNPAKKDPFLDF